MRDNNILLYSNECLKTTFQQKNLGIYFSKGFFSQTVVTAEGCEHMTEQKRKPECQIVGSRYISLFHSENFLRRKTVPVPKTLAIGA